MRRTLAPALVLALAAAAAVAGCTNPDFSREPLEDACPGSDTTAPVQERGDSSNLTCPANGSSPVEPGFADEGG